MKTADKFSVLLVVEPGVDGVFRYVESLVHYLVKNPYVNMHLAYSSNRGSAPLDHLVDELQGKGVQTFDLRVGNSPGPADLSALLRLWQFAKIVKPDVIHAHSSKAGVLARSLAMFGVDSHFFYTPHAYFQMNGPKSPKRWAYHAIERIFSKVGTSINISPSEAAFARKELHVPATRQALVPPGVNGERFQPPRDADEKRELRGLFGLPENVLLAGTVARYSEQKDPLTLYRALRIAFEKLPGLHFAHLGRGDLLPEVDAVLETWPEELRQRIHRTASHDRPEEFYRVLDCFVLDSLYEGFALAALEATMSNLPLILSICPGNVDLQDRGLDSIFWVKPQNPEVLAEALVQWAGRHEEANCNHREVAIEKFSERALFHKMMNLYQTATPLTS
jgi:glycosyltransferase involved in cell wall biosynthesis